MDVEYELSAKRVERNVLEAELDASELWDYDEYQHLQQRIATLERRVEGKEHDTETGHSPGIDFERETRG